MIASRSLTPGRLWWLVKHDVKRGFHASWNDRVTASKIFTHCRSLPPAGSAEAMSVHVLTGQSQCVMTAWMLASWLHFTNKPWNVMIHDDGTLTELQKQALIKLYPGATLVTREQSDSEMSGILQNQPHCWQYRNRHPLGLKAFDIPHMATGDRFLMIDSDVLFFRKPTEILKWVSDSNDSSCWFNRDPQEPAPISLEAAREELGIELWSQVNSGLCLLNRSIIRFPQFETWICHPAIVTGQAWRTEQTLLALAASQNGRGGLLPEIYAVTLESKVAEGATARHYVGAVRNHFFDEGIGKLKSVLLESR